MPKQIQMTSFRSMASKGMRERRKTSVRDLFVPQRFRNLMRVRRAESQEERIQQA